MFQEVATDPSALPGVVASLQSYGDSLNLHPHIHAIAARGVWSDDGSFEAIPALDTQQLMLPFRTSCAYHKTNPCMKFFFLISVSGSMQGTIHGSQEATG
jgi:hypothetical protein